MRQEITKLYDGLVNEFGHNDFDFQVTGGDRYVLNGNVYSYKTGNIVSGSGLTSPHIDTNGARAVDLRIRHNNGKTFSHLTIQKTIQSYGGELFYQGNRLPSYYTDGHHHLQLPNIKRYGGKY